MYNRTDCNGVVKIVEKLQFYYPLVTTSTKSQICDNIVYYFSWRALNLTNSYNEDNAAEYKCFCRVLIKLFPSLKRCVLRAEGPVFVILFSREG